MWRRFRHHRVRAAGTDHPGITMPILTVFGLATIEIWFAVPAGLALGVPPLALWLATLAGSLLSVTVVAFAGDSLRTWLIRKRGGGVIGGRGRLYRIWIHYRVIG